ncbi:hypothetical protein [Paenibacillus roseipurpureus]|uniref:Uncharacterized protein n=1 Tax=Paenibacillus roseopurpureus TaxID=2918901 RepID=A0AA96RJV8_9BACL|nr:hypothetical protein [Paenibacillus sp. MBLB1832]WNR43669.1 hypothetical protein MJB10_21590 [Paenibacillus sp. MBLB1832]
MISVPSLESLIEIVSKNNFENNLDVNPIEGFEVFNQETESGFIATITKDFSLISIDLYKPKLKNVVETLKSVLELYCLPTTYLYRDIEDFNIRHTEIITEYDEYWVHYRDFEEEEDLVLIRYRRFVEE